MDYIEDDELRGIFLDESQEHLAQLEACLLKLEVQPNDQALLDEAMREAHSLKGAARMLGVSGVERVAHRYEDILYEALHGAVTLTSEVVDSLAQCLDALSELVREAVTGEPVSFQISEVLVRLDSPALAAGKKEGSTEGTPVQPKPASVLTSEPEPESPPSPPPAPEPPPVPELSPLPSAETKSSPPPIISTDEQPYRIDTIRVDTRRLDALLDQTSELRVATARVQGRLSQTERLLDQADALSRVVKASGGLREGAGELLDALCDQAAQLRQTLFEDATTLEALTDALSDGTRRLRLLPLSTVFQQFQRPVRDIARQLGKEVHLVVEGGETTADKHLLEEIKDVLMHLLRNAIDHGLETPAARQTCNKPRTGEIRLDATRTATQIVITVADDGRGLDVQRLRRQAQKQRLASAAELQAMPLPTLYQMIFHPGFSTAETVTDISGRGVGMDVVRTRVEALKGHLRIESEPGRGCKVILTFPAAISTRQVFLVRVGRQLFAVPVDQVRLVRSLASGDLFRLDDRDMVGVADQAVVVSRLGELLELSQGEACGQTTNLATCLVLVAGEDQVGVLVDEVVDEVEVIIKPPGLLLKRVRNVTGVCVLGSGDVCVVLNPVDLIRTAIRQGGRIAAPPMAEEEAEMLHHTPVILLAEDSVTTRTQEKRILEGVGYQVVTAVDGLVALNLLAERRFDALVSDVEMPNMDGLTLTARLRQMEHCKDMPVVLVTSLSRDEDKRRGLEAGANAYLSKSAFNQQILLDTLGRLL